MKYKKTLFTRNIFNNYLMSPLKGMKTWFKHKDKLEHFIALDRYCCKITKPDKKFKKRSINRRSLLPMFYTYTVTILGYSLRKPKRTRILTMRKNIIPDNLHVFKYRKEGAK